MSFRTAIRDIVLAGGTVKFNCMWSVDDRFGDISLSSYRPRDIGDTDSPHYILFNVHCSWRGIVSYANLDRAVCELIAETFQRRNMALAFEGIRKRRRPGKDFDDMSQAEIKKAVALYNETHFDDDWADFRDLPKGFRSITRTPQNRRDVITEGL